MGVARGSAPAETAVVAAVRSVVRVRED
ncbi:hypothetical protein A2U01_0063926, partial [Trifolium medium]|nr:hypothetical protein [Trifolium medium]